MLLTHIYLIRHGETLWNMEERFQGQRDIDLNEEGLKQAEKLALFLASHPIEAIYSSDLKRARNTAIAISKVKNIDVETYVELRERNYGLLEGLTRDEIIARHPDIQFGPALGGTYGVETHEEMKERMTRRIIAIAKKHRNEHICIISHGGIINAFLDEISGGEYGPGKTKISNTGITHLSYHPETGWNIYTVNGIKHLM